MAKTRSEPAAKTASAPEPDKIPKALPEQDTNPPKALILPNAIGPNASIITLSHPRTSTPTRVYLCPDTGIYEFKKISAPAAQRSWLYTPDVVEVSTKGKESDEKAEDQTSIFKGGYVSKVPEFYTVTMIDPLFLTLPALCPPPKATKSESSKTLFLSIDDLFEEYTTTSKHFDRLLRHEATRQRIESRLQVICDTVEAGDERMYRLNNKKLLEELIKKAKRMIEHGLPGSMQQKFVKKPLEAPMMTVKRQALAENANKEDTTENTATQTTDSQSSTSTPITLDSQSSASTTITVPDEPSEHKATEPIIQLQRLRTALSFIISSYIPTHLSTTLRDLLSTEASGIDFKPLNSHLSLISKLKAEAAASRSMGDFSRKRAMEDDEAGEERAEKKRKKKEEEKRKKASESRAVRDLKKVNITGMKKLGAFFTKAPVTK